MRLLLSGSLLKPPRNFLFSEIVPPVCLSKPLPAPHGINLRALATQRFHGTAVVNVDHRFVSLSDFYEG
jgi:hypothetical protein